MQKIKLNNQEWEVDLNCSLGPPGGFGEVFRGKGTDGDDVAIKRLKVTAAQVAHRELQIGKALSERQFNNIVPILDYGQDADSDRYFLVMPICDKNLQGEINSRGKYSANEAIEILLAILSGLLEVKDITHRDIKPPNILLHEKIWKIADFGIAKFVEDSTSMETLRSSLTPSYAAPEQWNLQRPTIATDIYAVGCIAHALITGKPPFYGDMNELREKHLNQTPPSLSDLPASARNIVAHMLRKSIETRPKLERCIEVLRKALKDDVQKSRTVDSKMAEAVHAVAIEDAKREAENQAMEVRKQNRDAIFKDSIKELQHIKKHLFSEIEKHGIDVMKKNSSDSRISIGNAVLFFDASISNNLTGVKKNEAKEYGGEYKWGVHKRQSNWDIIAFTGIYIEQRVAHEVYKRSANIIFCRPDNNSEYRWYEMAFWSFTKKVRQDEPFCLEYVWDIDRVLAPGLDKYQLAYNPQPIDGENEDAFIEYWMELMSQAIIGKLNRPHRMPMKR